MSFNKNNKNEYKTLSSSKKKVDGKGDSQSTLRSSSKGDSQSTLRSSRKGRELNKLEVQDRKLKNYNKETEQKISPHYSVDGLSKKENAEELVLKPKKSTKQSKENSLIKRDKKEADEKNLKRIEEIKQPELEQDYSKILKEKKGKKQSKKDFDILKDESWVVRNGHHLTYLALFCFTVIVFFRPYELVSGLGFLSKSAFYLALITLFIYIPTQLSTEGSLTTLSTEVKCVIMITLIALITIPIAKSPSMAWEEFNDTFSKAVIMFVVMVNVLRTRERLMGIMWISLGMAFVLSYMAISMFMRGEITVEGYRVAVDIGGMFGNPNEMALHLLMMTPIAICLGAASKSKSVKLMYFIAATVFVAGNVVTYSRGGFLGLIAVSVVLIWKLGKEQRLKYFAVSAVVAVIFIALAPGEYGNRILSIFNSSLDSVGSSNQRTDLLKRSILVSIRNPWGIGIGNFPLVGQRNLGTHNSYTEVSSELGVLGLIFYLIFLISPFRKLAAIERRSSKRRKTNWYYYLAIGLQASIVGYMVTSFFAAVAYNWFMYYLIAYAVAFRRIYLIENGLEDEDIVPESITENLFGWQLKSS